MRTPYRSIKGVNNIEENNVKVFVLENENDFTTAQEAWDYICGGSQNIAYIKFKGANYIYAPQGNLTGSGVSLNFDFYRVESWSNASTGVISGVAFDIVRFTISNGNVTDIDNYPKFHLRVSQSLPATPDDNTLYFITGS